MKFQAALTGALAAVIGASTMTATPAEAQYYGAQYGYNNGRLNSYGDFGTNNSGPRFSNPRSNSFYQENNVSDKSSKKTHHDC